MEIADSGLRIAVAYDHEQLFVALLGAPSKLGRQGTLAETRFTGHETNLSLTFDHQAQLVIELLQLFISAYKDPIQRRCPMISPREKACQLGSAWSMPAFIPTSAIYL